MDREEKKLIDEIRNGLQDFEVPYEEGSWEKFQQMYQEKADNKQRSLRKTPLVPWKYIAAAAAVLIGALIYMPWQAPEEEINRQGPIARKERSPATDNEPVKRLSEVERKVVSSKRQVSSGEERVIEHVLASHQDEVMLTEPDAPDQEVAPTLPKDDTPPVRWRELTLASNDPLDEPAALDSRWKFGVEINSSLTSDKLQLAAGLLAQFQVSDKIKVATGLTYSSFAAVHAISPVQLSYDTRMIGGETTIKAIDIPLTVVYEPSDGWFASVGVSALAVLDENKIHRMESEALHETFVLDPESGASVSVFEVVKNEYIEQSTDTDFEGRNNLRYLNLSLGKKQRLNKRTEILFEPFVKIPMGDLKREDINLLNSGIKLKLLF